MKMENDIAAGSCYGNGETADDANPQNNEVNAALGNSQPKERCKYGASCYRINQDHKQQFSHPGDPDYDLPPDPDDRPDCKYGTSCYRRNPQHRRDYKHTAAPVKKKRKRVTRKEAESDQELSDDYDFEDPFINDSSSDDYEPTSSDSDQSSEDEELEEDNKRTFKEAKRFVAK